MTCGVPYVFEPLGLKVIKLIVESHRTFASPKEIAPLLNSFNFSTFQTFPDHVFRQP